MTGWSWSKIQRQRQVRQSRRDKATEEIIQLKEKGYLVISLTPYQFRINGILDLYPTNHRYHHIPTDKRGSYDKPEEIVKKLFWPEDQS